MSHNNSDIFCLKPPKPGENDGSELYCTNGSSFSKKHTKRQNLTNDAALEDKETNIPSKQTTIDETSESVEMKDFSDNLDSTLDSVAGDPMVASTFVKRNPLTGEGFEEKHRPGSRKKYDQQLGYGMMW